MSTQGDFLRMLDLWIAQKERRFEPLLKHHNRKHVVNNTCSHRRRRRRLVVMPVSCQRTLPCFFFLKKKKTPRGFFVRDDKRRCENQCIKTLSIFIGPPFSPSQAELITHNHQTQLVSFFCRKKGPQNWGTDRTVHEKATRRSFTA